MAMESNVQPSFIPKKSLNQSLAKPKSSFNVFSFLATLVFVLAILCAGAAFGFEKYFNSQLDQKQADLQQELNNFKQSLVDDLYRVDSKIESAKSLLQKHVSLSALFAVLGNATLKTVRFSNFNYSAGQGKNITVNMSGRAKNFASVALQRLEFEKSENKKYFSSPIFSDFSLDNSGNVTFSFSSSVDSKFLIVGAPASPVPVSASSTATSTPSNPN